MIAEPKAVMLVISATYSPSCVASSDGCASGLELSELQGEQPERVLARLMRLERAASGVEEPGLRGNRSGIGAACAALLGRLKGDVWV
jgi:hypothetical protein